jgi:tetratricopeptide (TPR) repeat protein
MKKIIFFLFLPLIFLFSCNSSVDNSKGDSVSNDAVKWNDSALSNYFYKDDSLTLVKKIALLDKATQIDSNFYIAYCNKLAFQNEAKQYVQALKTVKEIIRLSPATPDFYGTAGLLYERTGDSVNSAKYYSIAIERFNKVLDTVPAGSKNYYQYLSTKALTLIFSGNKEGYTILDSISKNENDSMAAKFASMYMTKTKEEILDAMENQRGN